MSNPKGKLRGWKSLMDLHPMGWSEPVSQLINLNAIDWMHIEKNELVVDIGVGGGGSIPFLLEWTSNIAVVDFSINGLKEISDKWGVCVIQADGSRLPFKSNVFDKTMSTYVFHNLPTETERQRFINEASRITKKGGLCVFARIPNKIAGYLQPLNYLSKKKLKAYILRSSLYYHTYTVNEIQLMLKEANLEMVEWRPTALPPPKIGIIRKKFGCLFLPQSWDASWFDVKAIKR